MPLSWMRMRLSAEFGRELQRLPLGAQGQIGDFIKLPARGLQTVHHHLGHAFNQFIAEIVIVLAMLA